MASASRAGNFDEKPPVNVDVHQVVGEDRDPLQPRLCVADLRAGALKREGP